MRGRRGDNRLEQTLLDDVVDAYEEWVEACERVHGCYTRWRAAKRVDAARAFALYSEMLDVEERAAERYRDLVSRLSRAERAKILGTPVSGSA